MSQEENRPGSPILQAIPGRPFQSFCPSPCYIRHIIGEQSLAYRTVAPPWFDLGRVDEGVHSPVPLSITSRKPSAARDEHLFADFPILLA
jgi:hypothetical protein